MLGVHNEHLVQLHTVAYLPGGSLGRPAGTIFLKTDSFYYPSFHPDHLRTFGLALVANFHLKSPKSP
jgi:hypothetical protein